jgi:thiamine-phosphate pyrophosphorylase
MSITRNGQDVPSQGWRASVASSLSVYLVTDRRLCAQRGVVTTVETAVSGGVTMVQLRDPSATGRELYELAACLVQHLAGSGIPLVVDDRADVALAVGAAGAHLGQADVPVPAIRAMVGPDLIIGLSVTRPGQVDEVLSWPPGTVDYLGVGPVYPTSTKTDAATPMGTEGLRAVVMASSVPCVAIGGIDLARAPEVMAAGASGVAVASAICAAGDPARAARQFRRAVGR